MTLRQRRTDHGFTLVELLVVIIVIGIIAAIAIPAFLNQRQKGFDAQVVSDVRNAGTIVTGIEEPLDTIFPAGKNSLYADNNSGLTTSSNTFWGDQPGAPALAVSDKVLVEVVHVTLRGSTWTRVHEPGEFCIVGRSLPSGKYDYPGGNAALYKDQAYYDSKLGGTVSFPEMLADYNGDRVGACYGYAKRFIEVGGTL